MLLTYLDRMRPGQAFLGTTNLDLGSLTERFQTRFQSVRLQAPENEVLAAFLARRWAVPITTTRMIAEGAQGNVRAALADLEMWMGLGEDQGSADSASESLLESSSKAARPPSASHHALTDWRSTRPC